MQTICMPAGAKWVIEQLNNNGFEAFIVGGCVRDSILGKMPNDWDITTSAKPEQMKAIFRRTVDTGIEHGTVTVLVDDEAYEVTTYRVDGVYEDHRRPKDVTFTANLEEDLKRRDFTINAMAYNDKDGVIDIFEGQKDLERGVIRCVGVPEERFNEDALRILRAVRFSAQLGFVIDDMTKEAMKKQARFLADISAERIQVELTKLLVSDHPNRLVDAYEMGITKVILPEFDAMMETEQNNPYHLYNVGIHTIKVIESIEPTMTLRYAALLHDCGKPLCKTTDEKGVDHFHNHQIKSEEMARQVIRRLKLDNKTLSEVRRLVLYHDYALNAANPDNKLGIKAFRRFLAKIGIENYEGYMKIRLADMAGQSDYNKQQKLDSIVYLDSMYEVIAGEKHCLKIADLAIGGKDLIELGMKPGRELGDTLDYLLEQVLDDPKLNDRETLISLVKGKK